MLSINIQNFPRDYTKLHGITPDYIGLNKITGITRDFIDYIGLRKITYNMTHSSVYIRL